MLLRGPSNARVLQVLDQLPKMAQLREQEVDLQHIGILFVLDKGLKGWFDERDFMVRTRAFGGPCHACSCPHTAQQGSCRDVPEALRQVEGARCGACHAASHDGLRAGAKLSTTAAGCWSAQCAVLLLLALSPFLQAYCTLQMWHVVCGSGGDELFARWFCKLLEASTAYQVVFDQCKKKRER